MGIANCLFPIGAYFGTLEVVEVCELMIKGVLALGG